MTSSRAHKARFAGRLTSKPAARFCKCVLLSLSLYLSGTAASYAECPVVNPRDQPVFWAFEEYVRDTYRRKSSVDRNPQREFELAYGHALGRLALAVNNDPARRDAFDCVAKGVDQLAHLKFGGLGPSVWIGVSEAARGMDDYAVNRRFGVTDTSPLEFVFAIVERMAGGGSTGGGSTGGGSTGGGSTGGGSQEPGLTILGEGTSPGGGSVGGGPPDPDSLPRPSTDFLSGNATPDRVCQADTPAAGQSIGTAFGTLGPWKYSYASKNSDKYNRGGTVVNLCERGTIEVQAGGTTYIGHYDGTEFSGVWFGNPSCSVMNSGYRCQSAPYGNTCWGEIAWRILDYLPEAHSDKKLGQVAFGYWNYCGKQGDQGKGGNWWFGDYYLYAVQQVTKP